jgi:7-carboxy-7-deazaguanine synthase
MGYAVKEIFYSLQGEGAQVGRPAVFLRFSGCNLWSGRVEDRDRGSGSCSLWCDTDFVGTDGSGGGKFDCHRELTAAVERAWPRDFLSRRFVVCTGGEPTLQLDESLTDALHSAGFEIAIETNGTRSPPRGVDWVCVSPKAGSSVVVQNGNELKLVYPQAGLDPAAFEGLDFDHYFLQPMYGADFDRNARLATEYCLSHPRWRLSIQTHKVLGLR